MSYPNVSRPPFAPGKAKPNSNIIVISVSDSEVSACELMKRMISTVVDEPGFLNHRPIGSDAVDPQNILVVAV